MDISMKAARVLLCCALASQVCSAVAGEEGPKKAQPLAKADALSADLPDATASKSALFDDDEPASANKPPPTVGWKGFAQGEFARAYRDPEHWTKERLLVDLSRQGRFSDQVKWKIGGRFVYDAAYDRSTYYPSPVRDDQRSYFELRENYLDVGAGDWEFRLGRQHVVWGEMVGLFFADVVSAKDMREFILPEFEVLRIPQWAARAEYFKNDWHAELLWIPLPSFDRIGKPGAEFYPYPLPVAASYLNEDRPVHKLGNTNFGFRLSQLKDGWDISGFYYHSVDAAPSFYRVSTPTMPLVFQPRHDQIDQLGGTLAKDLGTMVLKGEVVYTDGRKFNVTRLSQENGLVRQNTLDYALGLDVPLPSEARLNLQFYQRVFFAHDADIIPNRYESGASILLNGKLASSLEAQALFIHSLNRSDWLFRPRLAWDFQSNWRFMLGADIFGGPPTGLFGRYDNNDRVYTEMRYSF